VSEDQNMQIVLEVEDEPVHIGTSNTVTLVFESMLAEVHNGTLLPGDRVSDAQIAERFGISRTPVREALQKLREIGIIEAAANRFTRIAIVSPQQTANAVVVWNALFGAVVTEVVADVPDEVLETMRRDQQIFMSHITAGDMVQTASSSADFYTRLVALSNNPLLQRAITSVVHIVQLGSLHLPEQLDMLSLIASQEKMLEAVELGSVSVGLEALRMIAGIQIPTEALLESTEALLES
jgi:DNA-binding GntR family transcriptional regulator